MDELPRYIRSITRAYLEPIQDQTKFMAYKVHTINVNYCPWLSTLSELFV